MPRCEKGWKLSNSKKRPETCYKKTSSPEEDCVKYMPANDIKERKKYVRRPKEKIENSNFMYVNPLTSNMLKKVNHNLKMSSSPIRSKKINKNIIRSLRTYRSNIRGGLSL